MKCEVCGEKKGELFVAYYIVQRFVPYNIKSGEPVLLCCDCLQELDTAVNSCEDVREDYRKVKGG